jgi:hypothetical protein
MGPVHAIVWIDHQEAHVMKCDRERAEAQRVKARSDLPKSDQAATPTPR